MNEWIKSVFGLPWDLLNLGLQTFTNFTQRSLSGGLSDGNRAGASASSIPLRTHPASVPDAHVSEQRGQSAGQIGSGRLNTASFVVLGEGLAAGMGDFSLQADSQNSSFPAQMARQMGISFVQPLIEPPGIGETAGFAPWSVVVPSSLQSTVLGRIPPDSPANLSLPGLTVADAIRMRPQEPLVDRTSSKQTTLNLVLGLLPIAYGARPPWPTPLEAGLQRKPTLALIELGFTEVLDAAVNGDPARLPNTAAFSDDYAKIVRALRASGAEVVVLTIPDPLDTAYFSDIRTAARTVKLDPRLLVELWGLPEDALITVNGLNEISFQLYAASIGPALQSAIRHLPSGSMLPSGVATQLRSCVKMLNQEIAETATAEGATIYDLNSLIRRIHSAGAAVQGRTIAGDYLGGFYSLNGYYPGATGQAIIANELLALLNRNFGSSFPPINLAAVAASDPVAAYQNAAGPNWTRQDLTAPQPLPSPPAPTSPPILPQQPPPVSQVIETATHALRLPPELEQVLPIDPDGSYFGDALVAQNCRTAQAIQWASCGALYFRGLAMMDSHLSGNLRIKFSPPVNDWTTFQVSFERGLAGTDAFLAAPVFFRMPGKQQLVRDVPGFVSGGRLNLRTGQVDHTPGALKIYVSLFNSAIFALLRVNPNFPTNPLYFPGPYGSATVSFEQRPDGKLDFSFYGSTFVPLGSGSAFPLNFSGPSRQFASIPASGMAIHPHLSLTTKAAPASEKTAAPEIPFNTLQEFTLFTPASSFGDLFTLEACQLGGPALGRSRLLGRVQVQFGPPSRNSVPIAVSTSVPGGLLAPLGPGPLQELFPGRLTPGPEGFYENLHFPLRTYSLNDLSVLDDPFDLSVGALDLRTGRSLQPLLHRGFINQDLLFALLRVEPKTPQASFFFRGPATLNTRRSGQVFSFFGKVHIPYDWTYTAPDGPSQPPLLFPDPNLATGFPVAGGSLDPYLWLWGFRSQGGFDRATTGHDNEVLSSRGEIFSYRFRVPGGSATAETVFEYENHTLQGRFRMHSLAWVDFGNAGGGDCLDAVTFSGFGVWRTKAIERVTQAAAQFVNISGVTYVGIQIGPGGDISNVNTLTPSDAFPIPEFEAKAGSQPAPVALDPRRSRHIPDCNCRERGPMYSHIIELTAKPGQARVLVDVIRDRAIPEIIRLSPGFVDEIVLLSETDPNRVSAISFWRSKQDGDLFFQNGFAKVSAMTQPYLSAKPDRLAYVVGASTNDNIAGWP